MIRQPFIAAVALVILTGISCKKNSSSNCDDLQQHLIAGNTEEVKAVVTQTINQLPSKEYTKENVTRLAQKLSNSCITASVACFSCIYTLPEQSEIKLSFTYSGTTVQKTIDISYSSNNNIMKMLSMHE